MGLSILLLIVFVGLGVVAALIGVVAVVALSRREDFVNPFGGGKAEREMVQDNSARVSEPVSPYDSGHPVPDSEAELVDWLVAQASAQTGVNLAGDPMVRERMMSAVKKALAELKEQDSTTISMPFLTADANGPKHFEFKLTRQMTEKI